MAPNTERLQVFEGWLRDNGISWDDSISFVGGDTCCAGHGVIAASDIPAGHVVCTVPKSAVLSVQATDAAKVIAAEHSLGNDSALALAVARERALGAASRWQGYLQVLPQREDVPAFWGAEEKALLKGTSVAESVEREEAEAREEYETIIAPLCATHPELFPPGAVTLEGFRSALSLVSSRAFCVDRHHGDALVPVADMFNHKVSVLEGHHEVEELQENSDAGDSGDEVGKGEEEGEEEEEEGEVEEDEEGEDVDEREAEGEVDPKHALQLGICGNGTSSDTLSITVLRDTARGEEVFNTYGELAGADLVRKYGFALPGNPFDSVVIPVDQVLEAAEGVAGGKKKFAARADFLLSNAELFGIDSGEFEVPVSTGSEGAPPSPDLPLELLLAVHVAVAPASRLKGWRAMGEDGLREEMVALVEEPLTDAAREVIRAAACKRDAEYGGSLEGDVLALADLAAAPGTGRRWETKRPRRTAAAGAAAAGAGEARKARTVAACTLRVAERSILRDLTAL